MSVLKKRLASESGLADREPAADMNPGNLPRPALLFILECLDPRSVVALALACVRNSIVICGTLAVYGKWFAETGLFANILYEHWLWRLEFHFGISSRPAGCVAPTPETRQMVANSVVEFARLGSSGSSDNWIRCSQLRKLFVRLHNSIVRPLHCGILSDNTVFEARAYIPGGVVVGNLVARPSEDPDQPNTVLRVFASTRVCTILSFFSEDTEESFMRHNLAINNQSTRYLGLGLFETGEGKVRSMDTDLALSIPVSQFLGKRSFAFSEHKIGYTDDATRRVITLETENTDFCFQTQHGASVDLYFCQTVSPANLPALSNVFVERIGADNRRERLVVDNLSLPADRWLHVTVLVQIDEARFVTRHMLVEGNARPQHAQRLIVIDVPRDRAEPVTCRRFCIDFFPSLILAVHGINAPSGAISFLLRPAQFVYFDLQTLELRHFPALSRIIPHERLLTEPRPDSFFSIFNQQLSNFGGMRRDVPLHEYVTTEEVTCETIEVTRVV